LKKSYITINFILAGIIACIMLYSGIFSTEKANHPIPCFITVITGHTCPGCGLSRSFSAIIRLQFNKAYELNKEGPGIFLFFLIQLMLRLAINIGLKTQKEVPSALWICDAILSSLMFVWSFKGLIQAFMTFI
jgi:hypothetical protein